VNIKQLCSDLLGIGVMVVIVFFFFILLSACVDRPVPLKGFTLVETNSQQ
jgi:hypothetical protein